MRNYNKYKKLFKKRKNYNPLKIALIAAIVLIVMSIGYAALIDTLKIVGVANIGSFTIQYVLNGGTNVANPITRYDATTNAPLPIPTYANHNFLGWYDNDSFTGNALTTTPTRK